MHPYDLWGTKSLGFPHSVPMVCPGCGAMTCYKGWEILYKTNEFICRECYQKFSLFNCKTQHEIFNESKGDID